MSVGPSPYMMRGNDVAFTISMFDNRGLSLADWDCAGTIPLAPMTRSDG